MNDKLTEQGSEHSSDELVLPNIGTTAAETEPPMLRLGSKVVYANNWMSVREDAIRFQDGTTSIYGVVDKPDFAVVIAEEDGHFHLVEQYRYALGHRSWEFPMGGWPTGKTGTPLELAQAELIEETGLQARHWVHLGRLVQAGGYSSQGFDTYLATELAPGPTNREVTELDMVHTRVAEAEFAAMISDGRINDGVTVAAYTLLQLHRLKS